MVNRERPHLMVLPEDAANNDLVNGFLLHPDIESGQIRVLPSAGGWTRVRDDFASIHIKEMRRYPQRRMVLLVDFDEHRSRFDAVFAVVPDDLKNRVFVLGIFDEPEAVRHEIAVSIEELGEALAEECVKDQDALWNHRLLVNNREERERLRTAIRAFVIR